MPAVAKRVVLEEAFALLPEDIPVVVEGVVREDAIPPLPEGVVPGVERLDRLSTIVREDQRVGAGTAECIDQRSGNDHRTVRLDVGAVRVRGCPGVADQKGGQERQGALHSIETRPGPGYFPRLAEDCLDLGQRGQLVLRTGLWPLDRLPSFDLEDLGRGVLSDVLLECVEGPLLDARGMRG